jgi:hypothetical protein
LHFVGVKAGEIAWVNLGASAPYMEKKISNSEKGQKKLNLFGNQR